MWEGIEITYKQKEPKYVCVCIFVYLYIDNTHTGRGFPGDPDGKESACNEGNPGSFPGLERSPGEGKWLPTPVQDLIVKGLLVYSSHFIRAWYYSVQWASQVAPVVKNPPANAGDTELWVPFLGWEDPLE